MKQMLYLCAALICACCGAVCAYAQQISPELQEIRKSSLRLREVIYELSLRPGYVHLRDGNGWDVYLTSNIKQNLITIHLFDETSDEIDKVKVREEAIGGVSILKITTSTDDFYSYMGIVPVKVMHKVIW